MELWLILDGEKVGPLQDYEIRRRIETGEVDAETPAWHDGMREWKPLREITIFANEFSEPVASPPEVEIDVEAKPPPSPMPPPCYGRRFWARCFDFSIYSALWWFGMWLAGQDIEAAWVNPWVRFLQFIPWFAIEALLLHFIGTTPGKWLLGLRVVNHDGTKLGMSASTTRAVRVLFTGVGFVWAPLTLICLALSLYVARRIGSTLWDYAGGHRVTVAPLSVIRLIAFMLLFFGSIQLELAVVAPGAMREAIERYPQLREEFESNPPWQLPRRHG